MSEHLHEDHTHDERTVREGSGGNSITGYAAVKYGFIFLIVVAILYFVAAYAIPALTD
jgi:hypothetical protein